MLRCVPTAANGVEQGLRMQRVLHLELIERALLVGDHLSEFVVGGLQRKDICGHVRGLLGTS
jgi:hypothetical protein